MLTIVYAECRCARTSRRRLGAQGRVARVVADLATGVGPKLEVTQAELARAADTTRETANRTLAELERLGALTTGRGKVHVHDVALVKDYEAGDESTDLAASTVSSESTAGGCDD